MTKGAATGDTDPLLSRLEHMASIHRVRCCSVPMVWRKFGQGSPLVLLHGGHGSWMHWIRNIEALSAKHTLWLPDMPGFGESGDLKGQSDMADGFDRLIEAVATGIEGLLGSSTKFGLAGFSFGGLVAARIAARMTHVERLALLGAAGHGGRRRPAVEMANWRTDDRSQMLMALRHNLGALMLYEQASIDALAMEVHERMCRATRFRSKAISRTPLLAPALDRFSGPTLLLWGEHDPTAVPVEAAHQIAAGKPNRDWCLVPGAGHWLQYERAHEVSQLLLRWFSHS